MGCIYGLADPRTGALRYVGKTVRSLKLRLQGHVSKSDLARHSHKTNWVMSLLVAGVRPEIFEIEELPNEALDEAEIFYIQYFRSIGCSLTNTAPGGTSCGRKRSWEERRQMSVSRTGKFTEAQRQAAKLRGLTQRGIKRTPQAIANMSAARRGCITEKVREAGRRAGYARKGGTMPQSAKDAIRLKVAKLAEDDVRDIRLLLAEGQLTKVAIGKLKGVSPRCIGSIARNETWVGKGLI
jgi:hypothetical protein